MSNQRKNNQRKNQRDKISEFEIYASFLALPDDKKKEIFGFITDIEFAEKYKLSNQTLSRWKKDDKLWDMRDEHLKEFRKYTANVLRYLYAGMAEKKSASEAMAWFRLVESYTDKAEVNGKINIPELENLRLDIKKLSET